MGAFELENAREFDAVGYALWKVANVKTPLAALFCYCRQQREIPPFVTRLADEVLRQLPLLEGELVIVVGTRSASETFPDGYFRVFEWEPNSRRLIAPGLGGERR
jgi:hypothetical protein